MQERLESVGVKPEMAAILAAIIKIRYNGDAPDDPIEALRLFGGYIISIATKLDSIVPPTYTNLRIAEQNTRGGRVGRGRPFAEVIPFQEESLDDLTKIPPIFDRRGEELVVGNVDDDENKRFYAEWDYVEIGARIEELAECDVLNGSQFSELADLEAEQDRRREDADPDDESNDDIEGGQPAILKPPPPVNPKGPAPANAVPLDSDLNLILTV